MKFILTRCASLPCVVRNVPRIAIALFVLCLPQFASADPPEPARFLILVGAPGEPQFTNQFLHQATAWQQIAQQSKAMVSVIGIEGPGTNDLQRVREALAEIPPATPEPLFLVLIGHGTYDGRNARFNLRGPDLTATNLQQWLAPITRPTAIINLASASAPFIPALSRSNRVVLTATRSGNEINATHLGDAMAEALLDPAADLDQDGDTSLLEAFLAAQARTGEFYKTEGRLASEHALIDDNADGRGTPTEWFRGIRATRKASENVASDGLRTHQFLLSASPDTARLSPEQRTERDRIEREIEKLREGRPKNPDDAYYNRLESLLLQIPRPHADR